MLKTQLRKREKQLCKCNYFFYITIINASVTRFFDSGFFIEQLLLVPLDMHRKDFEIFQIQGVILDRN
jgi:hypothetical protein